MKQVLFIFLSFVLTTMTAFSQGAIDKYFSEYEEDEKFSVVYVSPKMFKMVSKVLSEQENQDLKDVVENLDGLKILKVADKHEYEVLMEVREGKHQKVQFLVKESGDVVNELLLLVGETPSADSAGEFVLMSFMGDIDLEKIAKLAKSLNIDGAEHLDMLDKK